MTNKQEQTASEGSTAVQVAGSLVVVHGPSYDEVRSIALDIYRMNFQHMAGEAAEIAKERAEQVTDAFLEKLQREHPDGFQKANDPGFQHALFTVQKEVARTGDTDLGKLLVDLLVDRTKHTERDILQIVLDESLSTAPKLTSEQLANLALMFLIKHTVNGKVVNHQELGSYFDTHILPLSGSLSGKDTAFQHLEFCGCGSMPPLFSKELGEQLGTTYQGLFLKGFTKQEVVDRGISVEEYPKFFMRCINDSSKIQIGMMNEEVFDNSIALNRVNEEHAKILKELFSLNKMSDAEIRKKSVEIRPAMSRVFEIWSESALKTFRLTSVGIAIGHANMKRIVGNDFTDLSIWIN